MKVLNVTDVYVLEYLRFNFKTQDCHEDEIAN